MAEIDTSSSGPKHSGNWWIATRARVGRFFRVAFRFWWLPFLTTTVGLAMAAWMIHQQQTFFVCSSRMMVSSRINLQQSAVFSEELGNFFGTQIELMTSGEVRKRAMHRLAAAEPTLQQTPVAVKVQLLPLTSIFSFTASGPEPLYTQRLLDAVMDEYIATKKEMRSSKSEVTHTAILDEISQIERDMHQGEEALLKFQRLNNLGFLQEEGNSAAAYVVKLNRQLAELKTQYNLLASLNVDEIIDLNQRNPGQAGDTAAQTNESQNLYDGAMQPESQYLHAKQQLDLLKAQRTGLSKVLRPKHPQIINFDHQIEQQLTVIEALRQQNTERFSNQRDSIAHQVENLEVSIKEWEIKALSLSERLGEYSQIKGKLDRSKNLYDRLLNNLHDVDVTQNIDQDSVSILEKATPPQPIKPGTFQAVLVGSIAGLLTGMAILFFIDYIDDRVLSLGDLRARFDEAVLAQIPREKHVGPLEPLHPSDGRHAFAEAFRALRSSIIYLPVDGSRPKTLLIAGATPDEGKSTAALNLALTMARADVHVLLVDSDLRRGGLHRSLKCPSEPGLSDLLAGKLALKDAILSTAAPNLDFIARGSLVGNTGELLLSPALDRFLRDVYNSYEYIIFDSSPILAADDATSLAPKIDATLFVIRFAHSSSGGSRKALDLLGERQANVVGIICNDVRPIDQEYYFYKYPEYYAATSS